MVFQKIFFTILKKKRVARFLARQSHPWCCYSIEEWQDITQKIIDFKHQIELAKSQINGLPGVNLSPEEQHKLEEYTKKQIVLKTDLLEKYKRLCAFQS